MSRPPRLKPLYLFLFTLIFGAVPAFCQTGVIQGVVTDPQGAVVPNTKLSAVDEAKGVVVRETLSSADGLFQLSPLLPGTYTVKAEAQGFKALERKGLVLDVNQIMNLGTLALQLGATTEAITVTAEVPLVETATAQKSFVLSSRQVTELSLNGRDFQSLMRTLPGVVSNDRSDFRLAFNNTDSFHTNGLRGSMNNFYLDGTINTDVGANDGQYTQMSMDAVGEFKEQTSVFNAEYGRNPGILLSAITKSGGSQFHGTGYEFLRNDALDANDFFRNRQLLPCPPTCNAPKPTLRFDQFGGNIGGPIPVLGSKGNRKLFFFFNYEGTRATRPNGPTSVDTVSPALLTGDFTSSIRGVQSTTAPGFDVGTVFRPGTITRNSAGQVTGGVSIGGCTTTFPVSAPGCNVVPALAFSKNAPAFLKVINLVDRSKGGPIAGVPDQVRVPVSDSYLFHKDQKVVRIDYNISPKTNFFFRWVDDSQRESQGFGIFSGNSFPILPQFRKKPGASWSWNLVKMISPATTNEFIFGYNHLTQVVDIVEATDPATYDRDKLGFTFKELFPNSNLRNKYPKFSCGAGCNFSAFPPGWRSEARSLAWTDNLTHIRGAHTFKTGLFFNLNPAGQQPFWIDATQVSFGPDQQNSNDTNNTLANLLLGNYTRLDQNNGVFFGSFRFIGLEFYGQDSWKVSRKLTLELGARYVYLGPTYTRGQFLQNYFDPARYDPSKAVTINTAPGLTQGSIVPGSGNPYNGMVQEGSGAPSGFYKHRKNQVSPRFGFAYDPFGDGKTSIRGGFGTFFERIRQNINNFDGLGNPPLALDPNIFNGQIDNLSPILIAGGTLFPPSVKSLDANGFIPTTYSWSFGIQRELPHQLAIDVSYVGNTVRHLQYIRDLNQLPLGSTTGPTCAPGTSTSVAAPCNPLPNFNNVTNAVRPFKGYTNVNFTELGANANYHALQVRASRRFAQDLTANVGYTWSKAIDWADNDGDGIGYFLNRAREKGPAGWDRTHVFTLDYVYQLPKFGTRMNSAVARKALDGWQVSGITRFASGPPFTVGSGGNPGTLGGGVRADYLGGPIDTVDTSKLPQPVDPRLVWFNPFAFGQPVNGSLGNQGRNSLRLPGINNWDISLFKNTLITERVTVQFRFETFNTFNHTQWAGVNTGISAPGPGQPVAPFVSSGNPGTVGASGQVNSARDPRNIQFGLKLYF